MKDYRVRQGATLPLSVEAEDASNATLTMLGQSTSQLISKSGSFTDGVADVSLDPADTLVEDTYDYMITVTYDNGTVAKFPDANCEGDDCSFPTITICEALDIPESS